MPPTHHQPAQFHWLALTLALPVVLLGGLAWWAVQGEQARAEADAKEDAIGDTIGIAAFCAASDDDPDKAAEPSWSQIKRSIEEGDNAAYIAIMVDRESTCVDFRLIGPFIPMTGVLLKRYKNFRTRDGSCRSVIKLRMPTPRGDLAEVFTWTKCLPEA